MVCFAMMADGSDEVIALVRFLEKEQFDKSRLAPELDNFLHRIEVQRLMNDPKPHRVGQQGGFGKVQGIRGRFNKKSVRCEMRGASFKVGANLEFYTLTCGQPMQVLLPTHTST